MCGFSGYSESSDYRGVAVDQTKSPIWRVSGDKKHIVFYGDASKCEGATSWCKEHCYIKTKPANALTKIDPTYNISHFLKPVHESIRTDFMLAKYVTMFGAGTIGTQFDVDLCDVVTRIPFAHPDKVFRFFIREKIIDSIENKPSPKVRVIREKIIEKVTIFSITPPNVRLVFSLDIYTDPDLVEWAFNAKDVSSLAVVNHKDNKYVIEYLKSRLPVVDCEVCQDTKYMCFRKRKKNLLLLNYI